MYTVPLTVIGILCLCHAFSENRSSPIVKIQIEQNTTLIEGTTDTNWNGETYFSFRGIPYAKPPLGALRFKDPQPLDYLPNYIDARYDGYECPSVAAKNASEDCLILNVYTKNLNPTNPMPVLVFVHPGGLYVGSSTSKFLDAHYLLTKNVLLVTLNYRLSALGFLNLGTKDVPGNAGFKDQVYALRWVESYIEYFGGNKDDVTLMGYSAGGQSTSLHLVSPMSKGLFHKAIIQSGVVPPQTILPEGDQMNLAVRQAYRLNCTIQNTPEEILNCLSHFNGTEIAGTVRSMFYFGKDNPIYLWRPVIERDFQQERFLTEDYYDLIKRGEFQRVPLLIGFTNGEFSNSGVEILNNAILKRQFYEEFQMLAPYILMLEEQVNASQKIEAIAEHYAGTKQPKDWELDQICDMISDAIIRFGSHRLGSLATKFVDVYAYNFVYKGAFGGHGARVDHSEDLMYLFRTPAHHFEKHEKDAKIVDLYVGFIWDFVTNGKISNAPTFPQGHTLINETFIQKNGSNFPDVKFWEELFP